MKNTTLVIMAAGLGSRFGGGIKQLEQLGPSGEIIMDYSIHDALEAGFNKVVFVIRKDLEKDFDRIIGQRIKEKVDVEYAYQEVSDIPEMFRGKFRERTKPWGTGQAILSCKDIVHEPFLVINADDYYGKQAFVDAHKYLVEEHAAKEDKISVGMIGFVLENTLSENGGVTRGICVTEGNKLRSITETSNIEKVGNTVISNGKVLDKKADVSMNMWCLQPEFFAVLNDGFFQFLSGLNAEDLKSEYLLPDVIGTLLKAGKADVEVLTSNDKWFGVTYAEDKESVSDSLANLGYSAI